MQDIQFIQNILFVLLMMSIYLGLATATVFLFTAYAEKSNSRFAQFLRELF